MRPLPLKMTTKMPAMLPLTTPMSTSLQAVHELRGLMFLLSVVPRSSDVEDPRDDQTPALGLIYECQMLGARVLVGVADPLPEDAPVFW